MTQPFLENFICPNFRCQSSFYVDVSATLQISATGASLAGEYYADGDNCCICLDCDYEDKVSQFTKTAQVQS
jgi:hypothetical protein